MQEADFEEGLLVEILTDWSLQTFFYRTVTSYDKNKFILKLEKIKSRSHFPHYLARVLSTGEFAN